MVRFFSALFFLFFAACFFLPVARAEEAPDLVRTIRVGLVEPPGQANDFAYRMLMDYLRGYLDEVSKKNRWQYLYVSGSYAECREQLLRGELDFVAPVCQGPGADGMIFTTGSPCSTLLHLYRRGDEPRLPMTPETVNGKVIGILEHQESMTALAYFLSKNDWHVTVRAFRDPNAMLGALRGGELDAVCDDGSHVTADERHAATFAMVSAQFMTTWEKSALAEQLTDTMLTIEMLDPDFGTIMKTKYVDKALQAIVRPTAAERMFVEESSVLRVGFLPDFEPFFTIRNNFEKSEGLYVDFLKLLSNVSGLRFSVRQVDSPDELIANMESGEIDLAFATYVNGFSPLTMHFSGDFRNEAYSVVRRRDRKVENFAKGAAVLPFGFLGVDNYFGNKYKKRVRMMATVEQCLDAVASGAYEEAYIPTMYLRRENSLFLRSDLEATKETTVPVALAASPRQPKILQDVLDTALLRMNNAEVERLAQENATPHLSVKYLLYRYPMQTALFFCFVLAGGVAMAFVLYRSRLQKQQNKILQKKNEDLEIALANVEAMRIARDGYKAESEMDKLTSVYNKAGFERIVREALSAPREGKGAVLFVIDLDHFKEANDSCGHQCGDAILQNFAEALKYVFRKGDCVGRFGGDEFTVFIDGTLTRDMVAKKAAQIVEAARAVAIEGMDIEVTGSVGAAIFPEHGASYDDLFKTADDALYKVKAGGRNGYSIGSDGIVR